MFASRVGQKRQLWTNKNTVSLHETLTQFIYTVTDVISCEINASFWLISQTYVHYTATHASYAEF